MTELNPLEINLQRAITKSIRKSSTKSQILERNEEHDLESNKDKLLAEQIEDIKHYRGLRKRYACLVFVFMCIWSGLMFAILFLKGFSCNFNLNDSVLVTLAGGTTVSVIGLVGFIIQGLFNSKNNNSIR